MNIWTFLTQNQETIIAFILGLISIVKLTSWGKAKAEALDTIVNVVERLGLSEVKNMVGAQDGHISQGAQDAIEHAVNKVDAKKRPKPLGERLAGELLRGVLRKR